MSAPSLFGVLAPEVFRESLFLLEGVRFEEVNCWFKVVSAGMANYN